MSQLSQILTSIPASHRTPLLKEYDILVTNYMEQRWESSEMGGGKFCEIVFSILEGIADGQYSPKPKKPPNMVEACRKLEQKTALPRSLRILIPRLLPALYEVRNNRGVGHVGSEVDPNHMDATLVLSMVNWIMAELIRELHSMPINEAQNLVDSLVERRIPLVWQDKDIRRVLNKKMSTREQVLILLASSSQSHSLEELLLWTEYKNKSDFKKIIKKLHTERYLEFSENSHAVKLLPLGSQLASKLTKKYAIHQ